MNGQYFPGSNEIQNNQAHKRMLREASRARQLRKAMPKKDIETSVKFSPRIPTPSLIEPLVSAVLTAAIVIQFAIYSSF